VRAEGDSIRVRWWEVGMTEQSTWNLDVTDDTYLTGQAFSFSHWRGALSGTRQAIIDDLDIQIINSPPVANGDSYSVEEDSVLSQSAPGVLGNDTDADGDDLTAVLQAGAAHGSVNFNANGGFTYTPDTDFSGTDSFTYRADDGLVDSNVATVTITVNAAGNVAPVAVNDSYVTDEDARLVVAAPGILGNDTDADGDRLKAVLVAGPANGNVRLKSNGGFTYTPAAGFSGADSFTYRARGGIANSNLATVTITVNAAPDQ
jgi:VCBS repeat-containing protein